MTSSNVIVSEMAQPRVGMRGANAGAFNALRDRPARVPKTPVVPEFRRVCCKTCSGKGCLGHCKF